jgi:hypothetical protein
MHYFVRKMANIFLLGRNESSRIVHQIESNPDPHRHQNDTDLKKNSPILLAVCRVANPDQHGSALLFGKLYSDPDPHWSERLNPDPH